ncbi:MAG: DUF362 domain-containing protein [Angelakisella sp.]|nr:DUF362 domain-containing protein [Angelakisella sp.]
MSCDVSLVRCTTYDLQEGKSALTRLLEPLGGLDWVTPGMKIVIKANLVAGRPPEDAVTTHPALLSALSALLTERGAKVVIGDSPGGVYNSAYLNRIYQRCGVTAALEHGAALNQNFEIKEGRLEGAAAAREFKYTAYLDEADAIINFCKLKTHGMMGMTCAAKNMFGIVPGSVKSEYHYRYNNPMDFARMIVDLNRAKPAWLHIVDAVVGMEGNGPTAGTPRPIGCLLAGKNPHTLDMICAEIIGLIPACIPTILAAQQMGLAPENPDEIATNQPWEPFCIPDFKNIRNADRLLKQNGNEALWGKAVNRLFAALIASRPGVNKKECIGCGECQRICPAGVITMTNGKPVIDRRKCIKCYCCQEFCPVGAMKVMRPPAAKLMEKL